MMEQNGTERGRGGGGSKAKKRKRLVQESAKDGQAFKRGKEKDGIVRVVKASLRKGDTFLGGATERESLHERLRAARMDARLESWGLQQVAWSAMTLAKNGNSHSGLRWDATPSLKAVSMAVERCSSADCISCSIPSASPSRRPCASEAMHSE